MYWPDLSLPGGDDYWDLETTRATKYWSVPLTNVVSTDFQADMEGYSVLARIIREYVGDSQYETIPKCVDDNDSMDSGDDSW